MRAARSRTLFMNGCWVVWWRAGGRTWRDRSTFFGGFFREATPVSAEIPLPNLEEFSPEERCAKRRKQQGFIFSGHPMDAYHERAKAAGAVPILSILEDCGDENGPVRYGDGQYVTVAGVVTSSKTKTTKNNTLMAYVMVEDSSASIELLCFSKVLSASGSYLSEGNALLLGAVFPCGMKRRLKLCVTKPFH